MSASGTDIAEALQNIADRVDVGMSEKDVENAFLNENFYSLLGYEGAGYDLRSEMTLPDNRRPDYITLDSNDSVTVVYEFKAPGENLDKHTDQLFHYTNALKAEYGVLTDGESFRWFRREDQHRMDDVPMAEATENQGSNIYSALRKPEWDIRNPEHVHEYIGQLREEGVDLESDLGQEHFFDTFRLEVGSPFAALVTSLMDLLTELRGEKDNQFVTSAFDFWTATYASEPDETPDSWEPFIDGDQSLEDFMFCLESGHALIARLLLTKATEDHDFFKGTGYSGMDDYFWGLQGFGTNINLEAYPVASVDLIHDMRDQLVEGLFQDDIFIWWTEAYQEQLDRGHATGASRFRDIAQEDARIERISEATQERFSRSVAHIFFNVLRFEFSQVKGDLLGDLYQRYFDPETRKALGEFYTPQPVVEYIMDGVDYNRGVSRERLIDPACGSGTFLVEGIQRYIDDVEYYHNNPDWEHHLQDLCAKPRIVGLDIHPFAVLMAQIRFVVAILPAYRRAKEQNPEFTLSRLPIYRTDTLRNERELSGVDIGQEGQRQITLTSLTEDQGDVLIPVPLPIEVDGGDEVETEDGFLVRRIRTPKYQQTRIETRIGSFDDYFVALQGVIDTVKEHVRLEEETDLEIGWRYRGGLEENIQRYTSTDYENVEEFFEPYVNDMLEHVRYLKEEHDDGRLFKMLEDAVLSLVVKNYMEYDYVVGNPPYVNIKHIGSSDQKSYKQLYDSAFGRFDLYVLFIERGLEMLTENGELGYITSNKFARSKYGREIRRIISSEYSLAEYIDFGDTDVFEDATNYPCILFIDCDRDRDFVPYAKIRQEHENVLDIVKTHLGDENYLSDGIEISRYPSAKLSEEVWTFTPEPVRDVVTKLHDEGERTIEETCLGVRQGVSSGGDDAFIVTPEYAEQKELEPELLYPIVRGGNVRRWIVDWEDELAIYPYNEDGKLVDLTEFSNVKEHLNKHREYLEDRYCVKTGKKGIYEYDGPRSKSVFEGDFRIPVPDMATENHFAYADGYECFKNTAYVLTFTEDQPYSELELLGLLNSSVAEFYIKQKSPFLNDRYFRYKSQYVEPIPLPVDTQNVESLVETILNFEELVRKVENFPDSYIAEFDGEISYITYEWQTNRNQVNAEIDVNDDDEISVVAGQTDKIIDPTMYSSRQEVRMRRAEYVLNAVNGRKVKKGEEITIPIPRSDNAVDSMLESLEQDQRKIHNGDLEKLESELDNMVYDLFGLNEEEEKIIRDYLDLF